MVKKKETEEVEVQDEFEGEEEDYDEEDDGEPTPLIANKKQELLEQKRKIDSEIHKMDLKEVQEQMANEFPLWKETIEKAITANQQALRIVYKRIQSIEQMIAK